MLASISGNAVVAKATVAKASVDRTVVAATKPKAKAPAKKVASTASKNKWVNNSDGFDASKFYGPDRKLFLPGGLLDPEEVPAYLDGTLAGDYGYDPLGLGKDGNVEKYREYEVMHARWAMLGAFGALLPEALSQFGGDSIPGAVWWQTGAVQLNGGDFSGKLSYLGNVPTLPLPINLAITVGVFFFLERFRASGEEQANMPGIFPNGPAAEPLYPGGSFDPLGLASDPEALAELKVKEIKNGRLAMVSMLGFAVQAAVTQEGPWANWTKHLADPFGYNLLTVLRAGERAATL